MNKIYLVFTSYGQYDYVTETVQFATFNKLTAQNWIEDYNLNLLDRESELREKEEDYSITGDELYELYELQDLGIAWVEETEVKP